MFSIPPGPDHHSSICLYELAYFEYFIQMKSYNLWPFVTSFFHSACFQISFFKLPNNNFIAQIYHILFIHLSVDGNVSCFHFEVTMSNTAMDIYVKVFV